MRLTRDDEVSTGSGSDRVVAIARIDIGCVCYPVHIRRPLIHSFLILIC